MRRSTTAVLLTVLALAGTACTSSSDGDSGKPAAKPSPTTDPGDQFMTSIIDAHLTSYATGIPTADELKTYPPKWCNALDAAHTVEWMLDQDDMYPVGERWGTEKSDAYQLILLGTKTYCPKWTKQVRGELRASGEY